MNNIFTEMRIPQLGDPNFQTDFTAFCNAMKQNIERLVSVQYTKGEPGNSVYTRRVHVGYTTASKLTKLSAGMLSTIFKTTFTTSNGPQDVYDRIAGTGTNIMVGNDYFTSGGVAPSIVVDNVEYKAIPSLMNNREGFDIEINVDEVTGEAYLASPYIFIDNRIAGLNRMVRRHAHDEEIYKSFVDFSVAIYGKGTYRPGQNINDPTSWNWEFSAVQIVPKLYFDDVINEFCWNVNGQETGITAQGIKGDDGLSPSVLIAIGRKSGAHLIIDRIQAVDENGTINWAQIVGGVWCYRYGGEYIEIEQPKTNDIALVFYPAENHVGNPSNPYEYAYLGKVYANNAGAHVYIGFDDDGKCDIFESIKLHDLWSLMLNINAYTTGAPRGYLLPADPGQSPSSGDPAQKPTQVHMTYSEKGSGHTDSAGFSKLHSAPVSRNTSPDPTSMSQNSNPPTHHIGDWQVDYNMGIQGNTSVQGTMTVQGDTYLQGNTYIQGDTYLQGNTYVQGGMTVQGSVVVQGTIIGGTGFTITGKPFGTVIGTPKVACMSRFKDVSYSLKRTINSTAKSFSYDLAMSGVLELNIGVLSWFNDSESYSAPHRALSEYGPNWKDFGDYSNAHKTDVSATNAFDGTDCKHRSKLYNVVKYEIPFDFVKSVTSPGTLYNSAGYKPNIFGFDYYPNYTSWKDVPRTIYKEKNTRGEISLRSVIEGFNRKKIKSNGSYDVWGSEILRTTDIDGVLYLDFDENHDPWNVANVSIEKIMQFYSSQTHSASNATQGAVTCLAKHPDGQRNITTGNGQKNYAIYGKLRYAPYMMELEYYFDIFPRIFEVDYTSWKTKRSANNTDYFYCSDVDYNIFLDIVPFGFVRYKQNSKEFHAPIWNAINVNNEHSNSIRANISGLNISLPNISVYDMEQEELIEQEFNYNGGSAEMSGGPGSGGSGGSGTSISGNVSGKDEDDQQDQNELSPGSNGSGNSDSESSITGNNTGRGQDEDSDSDTGAQASGQKSMSTSPPQPENPQSSTYVPYYTLANALVSNLYTETFSQTKNSNAINGSQSVILSGEDIESQYIIGLFDNPILKPTGKETIEVLTVNDLRANYFDITPSLRIVENNVKICPNNVCNGTWRWNTGETEIQWESAEPVPYVVIPYEGYVGSQFCAAQYPGYLKIGCGNFKPDDGDGNGYPVTLNGVLMYPFTPCMIMMTPSTATPSSGSGASGKENDSENGGTSGKEDGIGLNNGLSIVGSGGKGVSKGSGSDSIIQYVIDAIPDAQNDALSGGAHLLSNGRMLVTDGQVSGMITMISPRPKISLGQWSYVESSVVLQAQATTQTNVK